ncbi:MAG: succinate dehydrogenase, cytochrome b556 subunit [Hyphomonadaceae bacterium]
MAQAPTAARSRPLSPHLQVWRWHVTMAASILHRGTGLALAAGVIGLACWLSAAASGEAVFAEYDAIARSLQGQVALYGLVACLGFHLVNGVRHLFWDAGKGFSLPTANMTALFAITGFFAAPAALWIWLHV